MASHDTSLPPALARERETIREIALDYGLDFFEVVFEMVNFQQMNEIAAYMGFPTRYPHWRWGMEYERMRKSYTYGLHKIYEMVINNNPCYAYLLDSNELIDQKIVMAHVYGHSDFFKNNLWFGSTNRKMMDVMANHATRVRRISDRIGMDEVEEFIDICLSLENLIDRHAPYVVSPTARNDDDEEDLEVDLRRPTPAKLRVERSYMDAFINPPDLLRSEAERHQEELRSRVARFPSEPQRDVLKFLLENAPLERWQQDILEIIRKEAYYFAPQGMTKIMNEGWACLVGDSLLFTEQGLLPLKEIVDLQLALKVSDGETERAVTDWMTFTGRDTIRIRTRLGLQLEGSMTHRVLLSDGTWRRLDELAVGDSLRVEGGGNLWNDSYVPLEWTPRRHMIPALVASEVGPAIALSVFRYRKGGRRWYHGRPTTSSHFYLSDAETVSRMGVCNRPINMPSLVDEEFGAFLGYIVGHGYINKAKRAIGFTTADEEQANRVVALIERLFALCARKQKGPGRWRVTFRSGDVVEMLVSLGLPAGRLPGAKSVPAAILRSPRSVVIAFLRACFDCEGHVDQHGVTLSTAGERIAQQVQLLLLNLGILSRRHQQEGGCWRLHITGSHAGRYLRSVGFHSPRKRDALRAYLTTHSGVREQAWQDEIVAIERGRATVYDLTVAETHRYSAQGFINHNSYWHSTIMTRSGVMTDAEVVDYADHHSGTVAMSPQRINPYKIGLELFRDIEQRWDKGQFGKEWEECDDARARREWDLGLGLGRQKIFEIRRIFNDVGFIDTFFTEDFCNRNQLFTYHYNERTGRYEIESREFRAIKEKLLFSLTNFGQPSIVVVDANYENRGALLLDHNYEGVELKLDEARDTLKNLFALWKRPVYLHTVIDDVERLLSFDGKEHATRRLR